MLVSVIVAVGRSGVIGNKNRLPWRLPRDLKRFRDLTWGKPVIMGRRTLDSIGKPLKGRTNIVLTRRDFSPREGVMVAHSIDEALNLASGRLDDSKEVMIAGGGEIFRAMLPYYDRAYITTIDESFEGDTWFPIDELWKSKWTELIREYYPADSNNPHSYWYVVADRDHTAERRFEERIRGPRTAIV